MKPKFTPKDKRTLFWQRLTVVGYVVTIDLGLVLPFFMTMPWWQRAIVSVLCAVVGGGLWFLITFACVAAMEGIVCFTEWLRSMWNEEQVDHDY